MIPRFTSQRFWHGSPYLITEPYVVPGVERGICRYGDRNRLVFIASCRTTAEAMGTRYHDWEPLEASRQFAQYLYEVQPLGLVPWDKSPHPRWLPNELVCERAFIVKRYTLVRAEGFFDKPVPIYEAIA